MTAQPQPQPRRRRRAADAGPPGRSRALSVLAIVAVLLALGMTADLLAAPSPRPEPEPVARDAAAAGTWYCPSVAGEGERVLLTIAAVGDEPSRVIVDRYTKGRAEPGEPRAIKAGGAIVVALEGADAQAPVTVRWTGGPAVAQWRVVGSRTAAARCESAPSEQWHIAGFNSSLGSSPLLHLFNPFTGDAVVRLVFATPQGDQRLVLADNILVGAGGTTTVNLRKFQPEETDLGVTVEVLSGRVVAQGEQVIDPPRKASGATGRLLLSAAPASSESWSFAYAAAGENAESWLTVMNPNATEAAVEIRVSAPSQNASSFVGEISVPAGGLSRIELEGVSRRPEFGVTVQSVNKQAVVATRQTALTTAGRIAVFGDLGAAGLADTWALVGGGAKSRTGQVMVYNPGAEPVSVDFATPGAPNTWQSLPLPPNARRFVNLEAAGARGSTPVLVRADGPVVAEVRSRNTTGSSLGLWVNVGVGEPVWIGPATRPPVQRDPSLATHAGEDTETEAPLLDFDDDATEPPAGDAAGTSSEG